MNKAEEYIDLILKSDFSEKDLLKKEYPGVIEHDVKDLNIAKEIYSDLKKRCMEYKDGLLNAEELSKFCIHVMYSKYKPRVVSKIINDEIFDALDYISELDFYKQKDSEKEKREELE